MVTATAAATKPRVGGVSGETAWTGGSNLSALRNQSPEDVLCFRPETFKEMQKQHESLKQGLPLEQKLELVEGSRTTVVINSERKGQGKITIAKEGYLN